MCKQTASYGENCNIVIVLQDLIPFILSLIFRVPKKAWISILLSYISSPSSRENVSAYILILLNFAFQLNSSVSCFSISFSSIHLLFFYPTNFYFLAISFYMIIHRESNRITKKDLLTN